MKFHLYSYKYVRTLAPQMVLLTTIAVALPVASQQTSAVVSRPTFMEGYRARVASTRAEQPHWVTPLVTVTPRLEQEFRTDFVRQIQPALSTTWNLGNTKGLELIPTRRTEIILNIPPFLERSTHVHNGFGDPSFLLKYRFYASNEEKHNAIVTAFLAGTIPTGSYANGAPEGTISPTFAAGKGYRNVDVQSTLGATLPVANGAKIGRPIAWNTALQVKVGGRTGKAPSVWPQVESNATFYQGGTNDGRMQEFLTPGLIARFPLRSPVALVVGAGMQIATSSFHNNNHNVILTARIPF